MSNQVHVLQICIVIKEIHLMECGSDSWKCWKVYVCRKRAEWRISIINDQTDGIATG